MFRRTCVLVLVPVAIITGTACEKNLTATQVQEEQMKETRTHPRAYRDTMAANAVAQDMSVVDFHFVGHTAELSGTGVVRLDRMAKFLDTYGGTVRYDTSLTDEKLVTQRIEHVREYLALVGCDMDRVEVKTALSAGRGAPARTAIEKEESVAASTGQEGELSLGVSP